jgi:hypothetical protein
MIREQKIGDVGAGDEQDQSDNGRQDQQSAGELAAQLGIALGRRQ